MAVNQAQVDHILSTASADDPEVKLLKLQDEVELLKTSIKRLLIDIRERMNELDNPLHISDGMELRPATPAGPGQEKKQAAGEETPGSEETDVIMPETRPPKETVPRAAAPTGMAGDLESLAALHASLAAFGQAGGTRKESGDDHSDQAGEKVRLQKVFRLFEWTNRNVKRYGHDRVDLMLESFRAMGYISEESCKLVKDISRLMEMTLGEQHEIRAEEFVTELYELNRILNPQDVTLDRDMLDVLIARRGTDDKVRSSRTGSTPTETGSEISTRDRI